MSNAETSTPERAAAFFVDYDGLFHDLLGGIAANVRKRAVESALNLLTNLRARLRQEGTKMVLGRAYSAFDEYPGSEAAHALALSGFEPQYVVYTKGRTSADLQLSLDLLEVLLLRADIDTFVIIGGNQDLIPVARKVLEGRRELRIVALPHLASGDLIDRIGPERFLDATELIPVSDEGGGEHREHDTPRPVEPAVALASQPVRRGAKILGHTTLPQSSWTPRSDEDALAPERQERSLKLLIGLAERFANNDGKPEVWLSPFLKNEMAEHFPDLTHPQRRRLVNLLKEQGKILIEERESQTGPYPYSVVIINRDHPAVAELIA